MNKIFEEVDRNFCYCNPRDVDEDSCSLYWEDYEEEEEEE